MTAFTEGTANDWLAVAFIDGHGSARRPARAVFGVFVAAMTVGRMVGTVALDRWGRVPVLSATIVLAAAAGLWPCSSGSGRGGARRRRALGARRVARLPGRDERGGRRRGRAPARVSVVASIGYTAFLAGPPLVGLLGDQVGPCGRCSSPAGPRRSGSSPRPPPAPLRTPVAHPT